MSEISEEGVEDMFDGPPYEHPLALDWNRGVSPLHRRCRYCGDVYYVGMNPSKEEEDNCCYECFLRVKIILPLKKEVSTIKNEVSQTRNPFKKLFKILKYRKKLDELKQELEKRAKEVNEIERSKEELLERQRKIKI